MNMQVDFTNAIESIDSFECLLEKNGISIGRHESTGADMLSLWKILERLRKGGTASLDGHREEYAAGAAVHDLAAKVLAVQCHPDFESLLPHLAMLNNGAVHLTQDPPGNADVYNKLIEIYWACLLMASNARVLLDHPEHSKGDNPDVISLDGEERARAYAFKTVRSEHTQSLYDHLVKGIDQIERSEAKEGIVCFHLTPRILKLNLWPDGHYYSDWRAPAVMAIKSLSSMVNEVIKDNGVDNIEALFSGKKAAGTVLCLAIFTTVAKNPNSNKAIVMPVKVSTLVSMAPSKPPSSAIISEVCYANHSMQTLL